MMTTLYKDRAVQIDPNEYPGGWDNKDLVGDFIVAAIEECYDFLPDDWYVLNVDQNRRTITVCRHEYDDQMNLQPYWIFAMTADPIDEHHNEQWITFDVLLDDTSKVYAFQMP